MKQYKAGANKNLCCMLEYYATVTPNKVAVIDNGKKYTYKMLYNWVLYVAYELKREGIKDGDCIGIYLKRNIKYIVGVFSILYLGAIYLPLDPCYPNDRISYILDDSMSNLIIMEDVEKNIFFENNFMLYEIKDYLGEYNHGIESVYFIKNDEVATVIYTSGTTGKPKGIPITHDNINNYVSILNSRLDLREEDIYLHTASFAFSSSNRQIYLPRIMYLGFKQVL